MKRLFAWFNFLLPLVWGQICEDFCQGLSPNIDPSCITEGSQHWKVTKSEYSAFVIPSVPAFLLELKMNGNFAAAKTEMSIDVSLLQPSIKIRCRSRFEVNIMQDTSSCHDSSCATGTCSHLKSIISKGSSCQKVKCLQKEKK